MNDKAGICAVILICGLIMKVAFVGWAMGLANSVGEEQNGAT